MLDRRKEQRRPAYLGGVIAFAKHSATAECVIRNRSEGGVRLVVHNATFVPDEFELLIPNRQAAYRVRAAWRRLDQMGVSIVAPLAEDPRVNPLIAARSRRLEAENALLKRRLAGEA